MSYEEEDTCISRAARPTGRRRRIHACHMRRRIHAYLGQLVRQVGGGGYMHVSSSSNERTQYALGTHTVYKLYATSMCLVQLTSMCFMCLGIPLGRTP
jgi:hypothetical protein